MTHKSAPDFFCGYSSKEKKSKNRLVLCTKEAVLEPHRDTSAVLTTDPPKSIRNAKAYNFCEDGLYASSESPLTNRIVKPYPLEHKSAFSKSKDNDSGKLLEITVREVNMHPNDRSLKSPNITCVALIYKGKIICKANKPFNRKLHKLFIRNLPCPNVLEIQVQSQNNSTSTLPLPLPERCVRNKRLEIDFAMEDDNVIHSGTVVCSISLTLKGMNPKREMATSYLYAPPTTDDPNDPRNSSTLMRPRKDSHSGEVKYFLLYDPALWISAFPEDLQSKINNYARKPKPKPPDVVVAEQMFTFSDFSLRHLLRERRPLRPSSGTLAPKHHVGRRQILTVIVLRGVEVPVREESALIQPIVEIEWGDVIQATSASDGPAPIWQQTIQFEVPNIKSSAENCVIFRLFDQHPIWGMQWLGEARIPIDCHGNYQELERWIGLSPLCSPAISFGYVQASPGYSYTRIYVLMKMEQIGLTNPEDQSMVNALCKSIQRCLVAPYGISEIESPNDAAKLVMLLEPLPVRYGPLTPRQALNLNKVDHYGRSALLATLLQGFSLQTYVVLGSSQIRKWATFAITVESESKVTLWDSESGEHYDLDDNRCSLINVHRLINHQNIWENIQTNVPLANLKFDPRITGNWQLLFGNPSAIASASNAQTVTLTIGKDKDTDEKNVTEEIEQTLRDNLAQWRTSIELTTVYNRHADSILKEVLNNLVESNDDRIEKKELRKLYKAYFTHGFVINLRYANLDRLSSFLFSTKIHALSGPIEFALVCNVKKYVGRIRSIWLAVVALRSRNENMDYLR